MLLSPNLGGPHPGFQTNKIKERELTRKRELITGIKKEACPGVRRAGLGLVGESLPGSHKMGSKVHRGSLVSTQRKTQPGTESEAATETETRWARGTDPQRHNQTS